STSTPSARASAAEPSSAHGPDSRQTAQAGSHERSIHPSRPRRFASKRASTCAMRRTGVSRSSCTERDAALMIRSLSSMRGHRRLDRRRLALSLGRALAEEAAEEPTRAARRRLTRKHDIQHGCAAEEDQQADAENKAEIFALALGCEHD